MLKVFVSAFIFGNSMTWVSASASTHGRNRDLSSLFNIILSSCMSGLGFWFFKCFRVKGATVFLQPRGIQHTSALSTHFARWSHSQEDSWCNKVIPQAFVWLRLFSIHVRHRGNNKNKQRNQKSEHSRPASEQPRTACHYGIWGDQVIFSTYFPYRWDNWIREISKYMSRITWWMC